MEEENKDKEACELLKIWFYLHTSGTQWRTAKAALETRINILTREYDDTKLKTSQEAK